jgi:hypothetical protein
MDECRVNHEHERDVCQRFARWVGRQMGHVPEDYCVPEGDPTIDHNRDAQFRVGDQVFILEHTLLETYADQKWEDAKFRRIVYPLEATFPHEQLPLTCWRRALPIGPTSST